MIVRVWNSILNLGLFYILNLPGQTLGGSVNQVYILSTLGRDEFGQREEECKTWKYQLSSYNACIEYGYLLIFTFIPFLLSFKQLFFHSPQFIKFIYLVILMNSGEIQWVLLLWFYCFSMDNYFAQVVEPTLL